MLVAICVARSAGSSTGTGYRGPGESVGLDEAVGHPVGSEAESFFTVAVGVVVDLELGAVVAWAPEAEHTARNHPGLDFVFAAIDRSQLAEYAEQLGIEVAPPVRGEVHQIARTANTSLVGPAFSRFADIVATGACPRDVYGDDLLRAMVHALSENERVRRIGCARRIASRRVVHTCIGYAASIGRIPSISELCLAAHVSERRLREAFYDEFDVPPCRFFRAWALEEAHQRLMHSDLDTTTVTEVAISLGFDHLGRFSGHYKQIYGESPSITLKP